MVWVLAVSNSGHVCAQCELRIRRYAPTDALDNAVEGELVLGDIECCGNLAINGNNEVYIAADNGFYFLPNAEGADPDLGAVPLSNELYIDVTESELGERANDDRYVVAVTGEGNLER